MSISKNTIKYIRSLQLKKFRQKYNNFVLEGDKIAREILQQDKLRVAAIYALPQWIEANPSSLQRFPDRIHTITAEELQKISSLSTPNQVLIVAEQAQHDLDLNLLQDHLTLYLDGIQDPGNMGTILRIADWFGLPYVFCSEHCVDMYSPKVVQASMDALLRVDAIEMSLENLHQKLPTLPIMGAVLDGSNVFQTKLPAKGILVIGNESQGIAASTDALLTHRIAIPAAQQGGAESLNAAVATGILVAVLKNRI